MRALHHKALRDLWLMRGQALAIALVIASGIAMLVMSQATIDSLRSTSTRLYQAYRFSDVWSSLKRAPNSVANRLREIPGVGEVETRIATGAKVEVPGFDESVVASVLSLPNGGQPQQNRLYLRTGRMLLPDAAGEILVSDAFADAHRLAPGRPERPVGAVLSPAPPRDNTAARADKAVTAPLVRRGVGSLVAPS